MAGMVLASVPDNSEAGSYLTFAFPIILFAVIAVALYILLFARPHARVPARRITAVAHAGPPDPDAAHAAAVAGGLPLAEGGGSAESGTEPAGAVSAATAETETDPGATAGTGDRPARAGQGAAEHDGSAEGPASSEGPGASE